MKSFLSLLVFAGLFMGTLAHAQTADFFVAPDGKDSWSGTLPAPNSSANDGPFLTIARAQTGVRAVIKNAGTRTAPVIVMLRQGTYYQPSTLAFTSADSGTSVLPVIWQNYPSETVQVSGGIRIKNWTLVGGNRWQATLPSTAVNFEQLFYNHQRRFRPRLGASTANNNIGAYYRVADIVYLNAPGPPNTPPNANCTFYVSGSGWQCYDRFHYNPSDPISNTWRNLAPPSNNHCGESSGNPSLLGDIEVIDFEYFTSSRMRVSCVDAANSIVYLTGATTQPTNTLKVNFGFMVGHRFVIENVEDEFTQPGQWFLDRSKSPWVLNYLANSGENPVTDLVVVPQIPQLLIAYGLKYVTFRGITFEHDNFGVPAAGYPDMQLSTGISSALSFQNSSHITLDSDVVTQTFGGAVEFISCIDGSSSPWCVSTTSTGTTSSNIVENSALYDLGATGVRIGNINRPSDTDSSVPHGITVANTVIEGYGRAFPSTFAIAVGDSHDNTFTHNDIYDGYQSGISICSQGCPLGTANSHGAFNNTASFNHIYNLMQGVTDDGGGIYFNTSGVTASPTGNKVLNNKIHDITDASTQDSDGYGAIGIYLDKNTGNVDVENNLVYRVSYMAAQQTCGPQAPNSANTYKNNIFAFAKRGILLQGCEAPAANVKQLDFTSNIVLYGPNAEIQQGCAYCYGGKCSAIQNYANNLYCYGGVGGCGTTSYAFLTTDSSCSVSTHMPFSQWQGLGEDTGTVVTDPLFVAPFYPSNNFALRSTAATAKIGFVPFDLNAPGRAADAIQIPDIDSTFIGAPKIMLTQTAVTSSLRPTYYSQAVTFTATVISGYGAPQDGDEITFSDGNTVLAVKSMKGGMATFQTSTLGAGNHKVVASYGGDPLWNPSASSVLTQYVQEATSTTALTAGPNPGKAGSPVTFTATVSSQAGPPPGSVNFMWNSTVLGTATVNKGVATFTTSSLGSGTKEIRAMYVGTSNIAKSTSANVKLVVK